MAAPFGSDIEHSDWAVGRAASTGALYTVALLAVLGIALGLRVATRRDAERRVLASRAGQVEEQAGVVAEPARVGP